MNILVTAIGSFSADCVINTLKQKGHKVIGCDIYPSVWHPVSADCDNVYQAPYATEENDYIEFLVKICKKEDIQYIFPLTDLEIDVLNKYREIFIQNDILLCIQSEKCLKIARNKYTLTKLFEKSGRVNVPKSVASEYLKDDFFLPAIAKPINGRSSEGLIKINTVNELKEVASKSNYIVQEMLEGSVFTVDYVRDSFGNDFSVPREELLRTKNGAGTTVRIVPDEKLMETASFIGSGIGIVGCVNMEFIKNNDKYYLIDINPRFSAGVAFSSFIGYDMVSSHLNCFLNKSIQDKITFNEQIVAKRYREELLWKK